MYKSLCGLFKPDLLLERDHGQKRMYKLNKNGGLVLQANALMNSDSFDKIVSAARDEKTV